MDVIIIIVLVLGVPAMAIAYYSIRQRRKMEALRAPEPPGETIAAPPALSERLVKTRSALGARLSGLFGRGIDDAFWIEMEEALVSADVGVAAAGEVVGRVKAAKPADADEARRLLSDELVAVFADRDRRVNTESQPAAIVVVGVNGSGKTTFVAKLAARYQALGAKPLLGSADTFRAAADEQLRVWANDVGVEIVGGSEGADPASVAFDAYQAGRARGSDVIIIDTAGRLHSNTNLMQELGKVVRVLTKEAGHIDEVLLVLDGTGGQNGIAQAKTFLEAVGVTGIVITKLDGTAKGGIAVAVERELDIPVKLIGVGEGVDDLVLFEPVAFVGALLGDT
jgi:fused signal recognition particle receptor